jgi:hypothetical protein
LSSNRPTQPALTQKVGFTAGHDDGPLGTVAEKIEAALPFGQAGHDCSKLVKACEKLAFLRNLSSKTWQLQLSLMEQLQLGQ